jgi:hypothetical protein
MEMAQGVVVGRRNRLPHYFLSQAYGSTRAQEGRVGWGAGNGRKLLKQMGKESF